MADFPKNFPAKRIKKGGKGNIRAGRSKADPIRRISSGVETSALGCSGVGPGYHIKFMSYLCPFHLTGMAVGTENIFHPALVHLAQFEFPAATRLSSPKSCRNVVEIPPTGAAQDEFKWG